MQMVNLIEGGERARMSKRRGDFAKLDDLLDDIGTDATRFFMLMRSHDSPIDIDLESRRAHSSDNPVYYAQYAHARICSLFRAAAGCVRAKRKRPSRPGRNARAGRARPDRAAARDARPDQPRRDQAGAARHRHLRP